MIDDALENPFDCPVYSMQWDARQRAGSLAAQLAVLPGLIAKAEARAAEPDLLPTFRRSRLATVARMRVDLQRLQEHTA